MGAQDFFLYEETSSDLLKKMNKQRLANSKKYGSIIYGKTFDTFFRNERSPLLLNRYLSRSCLVYMFSLRFSGGKFLINLQQQFRVQKIFLCT